MTVHPPGHRLQQAVRWISDERRADPRASLSLLVERATSKFDLTPREGEELADFYRKASGEEGGPRGGS